MNDQTCFLQTRHHGNLHFGHFSEEKSINHDQEHQILFHLSKMAIHSQSYMKDSEQFPKRLVKIQKSSPH